jgi:hypothetical protein
MGMLSNKNLLELDLVHYIRFIHPIKIYFNDSGLGFGVMEYLGNCFLFNSLSINESSMLLINMNVTKGNVQ